MEGQQPSSGELQAQAAEKILQEAQMKETPASNESAEVQLQKELTKNAQDLQKNMAAFSEFPADTPISPDSAAKLDRVNTRMRTLNPIRKMVYGMMGTAAAIAEAGNYLTGGGMPPGEIALTTAGITAVMMAPMEAIAYRSEIAQKFKKGYESLKGLISRNKEPVNSNKASEGNKT